MVQHSTLDHSGLTGVISSYGSNANSVAAISAGGASTSASRADHVHVGVTSLTHTSNTMSGPITLVAQGSIGITKQNATTFAINAVAGSGSGGSGSSDLSGKELDYAEITSVATISGSDEGGADTVGTSNSINYDGSDVMVEVFLPQIFASAVIGSDINVLLYEGATLLGIIAVVRSETAQRGLSSPLARVKRSPSGSTAYTVKAFVTGGGSGGAGGGTGGSGNLVPGYIRVTVA